MDKIFVPILNKMYVVEKHTIMLFQDGDAIFSVDFRNYHFKSDKIIFLSPGQYFQLLSGSLKISSFEFSNDNINQLSNSRFLFKHLISLGYIDVNEENQFYLEQLNVIDISTESPAILSKSIEDWIRLNPFKASSSDINLLFDLKEIVDEKYREPISIHYISGVLKEKPYRINALAKEKLNNTVHKLANDKVLLESKRKVVFTDLSTKEIAYELGFTDPNYFNRFFKKETEMTPQEFREHFEFDERDSFYKELMYLIEINFKEHHFAAFYADKLYMTPKGLLKKVKTKFHISLGELISLRILKESKIMLQQHVPINTIAFELGFKEPNHFSVFFKSHTGLNPSQFNTKG